MEVGGLVGWPDGFKGGMLLFVSRSKEEGWSKMRVSFRGGGAVMAGRVCPQKTAKILM